MKKLLALILTIILFFSYIKINFYSEKYSNPLLNFEKSIFKILLLEKDIFDMNVATGSGFVFKHFNGKSYLLTNDHLCDSEFDAILIQDIENVYMGGGMGGRVIVTDKSKDLCILSTNNELDPLEIERKPKLNIGEELFIIGAPEGDFPHISKVIVTDPDFEKHYLKDVFYDLDFKYNPILISGDVFYGQSGSPVINSRGKVVGIIFAKSGPNSGLVIRAEEINDFVESIYLD